MFFVFFFINCHIIDEESLTERFEDDHHEVNSRTTERLINPLVLYVICDSGVAAFKPLSPEFEQK